MKIDLKDQVELDRLQKERDQIIAKMKEYADAMAALSKQADDKKELIKNILKKYQA